MANSCEAFIGALFCFECFCITWKSLIGLIGPLVVTGIFARRVLSEISVDDLLILGFASIFTYASKKITGEGVSVSPWMLYITMMWACFSVSSERTAGMRSVPMVWSLVFVSVLFTDVLSAFVDVPKGTSVTPGGNGLIDGLLLWPSIGAFTTYLTYRVKIFKKSRDASKGKTTAYDAESVSFLTNVSPRFRRSAHLFGQLGGNSTGA